MFEGQTMVEEGKVREGKGGGLVVCYRGTWLPQVCVPNVPLSYHPFFSIINIRTDQTLIFFAISITITIGRSVSALMWRLGRK